MTPEDYEIAGNVLGTAVAVIAEKSQCTGGDIVKLLLRAARCGADAVKMPLHEYEDHLISAIVDRRLQHLACPAHKGVVPC
jgi:hypothetical protein